MGKTHLLSVFAGRARAAGATVLAGRCDELDRTLPLEAVAEALSRHLRAAGPEAADRLLGPDAAALAPILGQSVPGGVGVATVAALADPATGRAVLFDAMTGLVERVAGNGCVALLLDDAHQAGTATIEWLRFAAHRNPDLPLLVVAAQRTEEALTFADSSVLTLGPLDLAAAREVVGAERAVDLLARSGGVPLFLVELAAAHPGEELPASVRQSVAERVERAGAAASTLRTAAVIGPDIDVDLLAAVLRLAPVELLDHLEEGVRHRFLVESESGFTFRHDLVREALATGTGAARRALVHREAGRALAARAKADPLRVAYHARLGGDDERAGAALIEAARLAAERHDLADAERRLDQALALADGPPVRLARARVRILRGDFSGAATDAGAALGQGGGAEALEVAGWAAYHQREFSTAIRLAADGASLAPEPALRASCLGLGGYARTMSGDLAGAEAALEEALCLAPHSNRVACAGWLGMLRVYQGRAREGLDLLRPATLPGAPAAGFSSLRARQQAAYALALLGRPAEALAAFDDLEVEIARRQVERYTGLIENFRGWILRQLGAHREADEANHRGLAAAARLATTQPRVHAEQRAHGLLDLADGCLQEGDPGDARRYLSQLTELQEVEYGLRWRHELRARLLAGRLALVEEHWEDGQAAAADLAEESGRLGIARYGAAARILDAQARAGAGDTIDVDGLAPLLESLPDLAGLEAWWLTAQAARATGIDAWWELAERRVARLAGEAGERGDGLRRYAAARLERMRTGGR
jgi:tetratricopeptide (TPR) repeat protein